MKKKIKKWLLRLTVTGLLIAGLLLVIVLNPVLVYANKTTHNNYTIFHNKPLDPDLSLRLDKAEALVQKSEFYNARLRLDICLNDGSNYPKLMKILRGPAFAWGFYNKVVLMGYADYKNNYVTLNGYKWNLTQLLAHEMIHCYQFKKRGFWKSKPVANIPNWKWEGYPEYIARQNNDQKDLQKNIDRLIATEQKNTNGWIQFEDNTGTVIPYYKNWLLVQYCLDMKKMSYEQLLRDTTTEILVEQQMMDWYQHRRNR
jgi:hypothetical protein